MNKTIEQTIDFKGVTAAELFSTYVDPKKHSLLHGGAKTRISAKEGDKFSLLNGNLNGRNLLVVPNRMIVQSWRGSVWYDHDLDSILTLTFHDTTDGAQIVMTHSFTPSQFRELWNDVYWQPMQNLLKK
jgi:activator of HSP90 ATPase